MEIYENLDINDLDGEIWKVIKDFPDYYVSNLGRVKSLKFGKERMLKQNKNNKGYFQIDLCKSGKIKNKKIHILVYETFNDYKLKKNECVHHDKDISKENNNFYNLIMMSKKEHARLHSKFLSEESKKKMSEKKKGENHPNFKLTNQLRTNIEIDIEKGDLTQIEMAKKYEVCQTTISYIKNHKI